MPLVVKQDEAADPTDVGVFGAQRQVPQPRSRSRFNATPNNRPRKTRKDITIGRGEWRVSPFVCFEYFVVAFPVL